ncbi:AAA family ATPase [Vibrio vulnificus]|uniref:AAA family ATPase n=1 Tax=Vibrio vulnificus TaxID=672 RepID=UPI0024DF81E6|nr:AAA family ATPase [Vibrio vulnificus]EHK9002208.1 AAA family ATPase [Vibrio vulnificus]MDK2608549.1 AAA family ATPase [Vibrio vulnificus]MDK2611926.1 AAA family ATPase [Vibrio vulnificus]MDK2630805.1 AAA family ATPase [Vibrio vulnificus]MDK2705065.1 AAA family ATPase [Vibrio vulnificus]
MIKTITLKGVASYSQTSPVVIQTDNKKINLLYGLNGSGKSTIGKFLHSPELPEYRNCSIQPSELDEDILVYNQEFIRSNFYEIPDFQGVFTLSEENKEAEQAIEEATQNTAHLSQNIEVSETKKSRKKSDIENEETSLKESVWKAKTTYENGALDFCLDGLRRNKLGFLNKVRSSSGNVTSTIESLQKEARELSGQDASLLPSVPMINLDVSSFENDPILAQVIVGSKDSYLSDLVEQLGNSDWVKSGLGYMKPDNPCPFCQQELSSSITEAINQLFDETYSKKVSQIEGLFSSYRALVEDIESKLSAPVYTFEDDVITYGFVDKRELLLEKLSANLSQIDLKIRNPSTVVTLTDTSALVADVNTAIAEIQRDIDLFNDKIRNKKSHLDRIASEFWMILNGQFSALITASDKKVNDLQDEVKQISDEIELFHSQKITQTNIITENQKKITNIDSSINNINQQLAELGIHSFKIVKAADDQQRYKIARPTGESVDVYNTLSEGEKTLISFLYFLECASGSTNESSPVLLNNRIVVIDDPISSLSHNYVYDIAALIHHKVFSENFKQVFLLTHNLFFFHELLMLKNASNKCPAGYKLFRVAKSQFSLVHDLKRDELQNDYQMYWQVVKDSISNPSYAHMLPNAMRNILEHYFNFVHKKESLKQTLEQLGQTESDFKPLFRYINRESHSDSINLVDFERINAERYIEKFKQIFVETGFEEHYNSMMGIESTAEVVAEAEPA